MMNLHQIVRGAINAVNPDQDVTIKVNKGIVSHKLATLNELETVFGLEDAINLYEIIAIDTYNEYR